jgi:hypothetical protein
MIAEALSQAERDGLRLLRPTTLKLVVSREVERSLIGKGLARRGPRGLGLTILGEQVVRVL